MISEKLQTRIVATVLVVWTMNFALSIVPQFEYKMDPMINGIFLAVAGGVIGASARAKVNSKETTDE